MIHDNCLLEQSNNVFNYLQPTLIGYAEFIDILLLEAVTGRDPVDYGRPANEVRLR